MNIWKPLTSQCGAVAILVAISTIMFLSFAALVIDGGFGWVTRNELKNVADGAALAGTRVLGDIYCCRGMTPVQQQTYILTAAHRAEIIAVVQDVAANNMAGGKSLTIDSGDIQIGQWGRWDGAGNWDNTKPQSLKVTDTRPDAVQVTGRRDTVANGPIATFLARLLGVNALNVTSTSVNTNVTPNTSMRPTAALTGVSHVEPGELDIPVGISQTWFDSKATFCGEAVQFYPTNSAIGCAGWNTFYETPASSSTLNKILQKMLDGTYTTPEVTAGQDYMQFTGGNVASALPDLKKLFEEKAICSSTGIACKNGPCAGTCEWETFVTVYQSNDCKNPSGAILVKGFATVIITEVQAPPEGQLIKGKVLCNVVQGSTRGGGGEYGTKGSIPGLVQ